MSTNAETVVIQGKQLSCSHCGGLHFDRRNAQLNTRVMTFLKFDWLNKTSEVFVCANCGHLEWFLDPRG